jgi:hypothetical protein
MRAGSKGLASMTRILRLLLALAACLGAGARASHAGNLEVHESSVGIGQVRALAGPVTNALIDLDYAPSSAEGGKLFGMSELEIETTGDLVLTPVGFICQATSCLYSPQPFVTGNRIQITAGDDLAGETASAANLVRFGLTGTTGHVVVTGGEYLDGTGPGVTVGAVQTLDITILATVPEPDLASGLVAACALLVLAARTTSRRRGPRTKTC